MDVRTFEAFSMKEAVKSVKKALGADAVILATREKPAPGGKGTLYEVTAAASSTSHKAGASLALQSLSATNYDKQAALEVEALAARVAALADVVATRAQVQAIEAGMHELKLLLLESLRNKDGSTLKDLPAELVPIERQLRVMGIADTQIAELMHHLRTVPAAESSQQAEGYWRDHAIRWMIKRIKIAPKWNVLPGAVSYQAIVGPTGVGKTSMTAKLAAFYALREKSQVCVVSLDQQRLAASEQMRIFCRIINVPFLAASCPADIATVVHTHKDVELVLIDTAGLSPKNRSGIAEIATLKDTGLPIDFHLCLSVTEKEIQLEQEVRAFLNLGLTSLIFSKLDESWAYGEMFNIAKKWALPLSFFSIGQQLPEDIERATRERVIERIFGL